MNAGMKNGINLLMILVLFISCVQEKEDNNVSFPDLARRFFFL